MKPSRLAALPTRQNRKKQNPTLLNCRETETTPLRSLTELSDIIQVPRSRRILGLTFDKNQTVSSLSCLFFFTTKFHYSFFILKNKATRFLLHLANSQCAQLSFSQLYIYICTYKHIKVWSFLISFSDFQAWMDCGDLIGLWCLCCYCFSIIWASVGVSTVKVCKSSAAALLDDQVGVFAEMGFWFLVFWCRFGFVEV